ncbi:unnamed protein product [Rotaria magnacalcarata]|uniref:Adenosine kinase n=1 Tax=Rotaria magnacalcarata TaxID=392030 RepID=A0A819QLS3_9BILA|nr:unnamed protein product [Rotaria magnacalcarata]
MSTTTSLVSDLSNGTFFAIGNPLLDINAIVDSEFLEKYKLEANDAILATSEHEELFQEIKHHKQVQFFVGGSAQNMMRTIIWFLQKPKVAAYMGCVGNDASFDRLQELADSAGLITSYQIKSGFPTGKCAVLTTEHSRSMVASLGAAQHFTVDYLDIPENRLLFENAKIICCEAFFIQSSFDSLLELAEHAYEYQKIFCITLSSKHVVKKRNGNHLLTAWPYADYIFGYEEETKLFAKEHLHIQTDDLHAIITALLDIPKLNKSRPRIIIISRLLERTLVGKGTEITEYTWKWPPHIADTHGCGEAFVGGIALKAFHVCSGYLAYMALDKSIDESVKAGIYCAYECLQQTGCTFPDRVSYDPVTFWK